jgi:hypothetical protein
MEGLMANRNNFDTDSATDITRDSDWLNEERYWRSNFSSRPYVQRDRGFEFYQPGYRYGFESATRYRGKEWKDIEPDLRSGWERYEHRGQSKWEHVKDAVKDAWDRMLHLGRTSTDRDARTF